MNDLTVYKTRIQMYIRAHSTRPSEETRTSVPNIQRTANALEKAVRPL